VARPTLIARLVAGGVESGGGVVGNNILHGSRGSTIISTFHYCSISRFPVSLFLSDVIPRMSVHFVHVSTHIWGPMFHDCGIIMGVGSVGHWHTLVITRRGCPINFQLVLSTAHSCPSSTDMYALVIEIKSNSISTSENVRQLVTSTNAA